MRNLTVIIFFLAMGQCFGQDMVFFPLFTKPEKWHIIDTISVGDTSCVHDFVSSKPYYLRSQFLACAVNHGSERCSWTERHRKSICKKCHFHVLESDFENTLQIDALEPESEYDKIIKKQ